MKVEVECPQCDERFKVAEEFVGRRGRCPSCQSAFVITAASDNQPRRKKRKSDSAKDTLQNDSVQKDSPSQKKSPRRSSGSPVLPMIGTVAVLGGIAVGSVFYFAMNKSKPQAGATAVASTSPQSLVSTLATSSASMPPAAASDEPADQKVAASSPELSQGSTAAVPQPKEPPTEKPKEAKADPVEITFPAKRKFEHRWPILEKKTDDKLLIYTLLARTKADDKEDTVVFIDLIAQDPMQNPNGRSLWEAVQLRVETEAKTWRKMNENTLFITLDGDEQNIATYQRRKDQDNFAVMLPLSDFQKMLNAQQIRIRGGPRSVTLNENHIEGMRDLASRAAEGKTKEGNFIVKLKADPAAATVANRPSPEEEELPPALAEINSRCKKEILEQIQKINTTKQELKQARIADDAKSAAKATRQITEEQARLRELIDTPLEMPLLIPYRFTIGAVGQLSPSPLKVIQVIDRKKGELLVDSTDFRNSKEFIISGINADNLVDRDFTRIGRNLCFHIASIEDYKTVDGGTNSVYRLEAYPANLQISEADRKIYDDAINAEYKIELTAEEEAQAQKSREASAQQNMDKEKLARSRRSKSNLESAKLLLRKEEKAAAKKYLEKAIADDPDSEAGKEAAKLLEELP